MSNHVEQARQFLRQENFKAAERELRLALENDPDNLDVRTVLSVCLLQRQRHQEAIQAWKIVVQNTPDISYNHYVLANMYYEYFLWLLQEPPDHTLEQLFHAKDAINAALKLDSDIPEYWAFLGSILIEEGEWAGGTLPSRSIWNILSGKELMAIANRRKFRQVSLEKALKAAEQGLKLEPNHSQCIQVKASILKTLGRAQEARTTILKYNLFKKMSGEAPDPESYYNLGWFAIDEGSRTEALKLFKQAIELDSQFEEARQAIVETSKRHYLIYRLLSPSMPCGLMIMGLLFGVAALNYWLLFLPRWASGIIAALGGAIALVPWLFINVLRFKSSERKYLALNDIVVANYLVTLLLFIVVTAFITWGLPRQDGEPPFQFVPILTSVLMPISVTLAHSAGTRRCWMAKYAALIVCLAALGTGLPAALQFLPPFLALPVVAIGFFSSAMTIGGAILSYWIGTGVVKHFVADTAEY